MPVTAVGTVEEHLPLELGERLLWGFAERLAVALRERLAVSVEAESPVPEYFEAG